VAPRTYVPSAKGVSSFSFSFRFVVSESFKRALVEPAPPLGFAEELGARGGERVASRGGDDARHRLRRRRIFQVCSA
jgi:hypothetical protein